MGIKKKFNPCSRGCFARSLGAIHQPPLIPLVSILVLVDVSPEDKEYIPPGFDPQFQSLFSWMFRPKPSLPGVVTGSLVVSILVLVDVSPEAVRNTTMPSREGVSILVLVDVSPEAGTDTEMTERALVSILVLVDVSPEVEDGEAHITKGGLFQSLFSWMFRPKSR